MNSGFARPSIAHHGAARVAVIGAGPNGLTAAAVLAQAGCRVEVFEAAAHIGGSARTHSAFGPGSAVDFGAAAHPFGVVSPAFRQLGLENYGLEWKHPHYPMAHPLADAPAAIVHRDLVTTAAQFSDHDRRMWNHLHRPLVDGVGKLVNSVLPVRPRHPVALARLGLRGVWSASSLSSRLLADESARALLVGSAVHAIRPPSQPGTAAFGLLFNALGMSTGWPVISDGTGQLTRALARVIEHYGGTIETGAEIRDLSGFATYDAVVTTQTPRQLLALEGLELSRLRSRSLRRWKYGTAVYKVDYLINGPVKWNDPRVAEAGTVHVGGSVSEMQLAESQAAAGTLPERPFVMVCQQQAADPTRLSGSRWSVGAGRVASAQPDSGKVSEDSTQPHILWAYAHVPHGYQEKIPHEVAGLIEAQISRYASGFSAQIIERHQVSPAQLQESNANLIGGDIAGGAMNVAQMLRQRQYIGTLAMNPEVPVLQASGASLPGAGVHGMAGWRAAHRVLRRLAD